MMPTGMTVGSSPSRREAKGLLPTQATVHSPMTWSARSLTGVVTQHGLGHRAREQSAEPGAKRGGDAKPHPRGRANITMDIPRRPSAAAALGWKATGSWAAAS